MLILVRSISVFDRVRNRYSISSSARSKIDCGTVRPSALAVLRFTTISNFVGNCTGRSPGFEPRRMRSTNAQRPKAKSHSALFDRFVGDGEQHRRYRDAELARRLHVDDEIELGRLLYW